MEHEELVPKAFSASSAKDQIELVLFGIDKKWVHKGKGWIDKAKSQEPEMAPLEQAWKEPTSKWWQFWKK